MIGTYVRLVSATTGGRASAATCVDWERERPGLVEEAGALDSWGAEDQFRGAIRSKNAPGVKPTGSIS